MINSTLSITVNINAHDSIITPSTTITITVVVTITTITMIAINTMIIIITSTRLSVLPLLTLF